MILSFFRLVKSIPFHSTPLKSSSLYPRNLKGKEICWFVTFPQHAQQKLRMIISMKTGPGRKV
jgi:hypothetical protein